MLTLFHSPQSRSSAIVTLIEEMGIAGLDRHPRRDDPAHGRIGRARPGEPASRRQGARAWCMTAQVITERAAIILHLTSAVPRYRHGAEAGHAGLGRLRVLAGLVSGRAGAGVHHGGCRRSRHPWMTATFRGPRRRPARLRAALEKGPWLMGESFSAADLLVHSPYAWFPDATPDDPLIRDWVERCKARPARLNGLVADDERGWLRRWRPEAPGPSAP